MLQNLSIKYISHPFQTNKQHIKRQHPIDRYFNRRSFCFFWVNFLVFREDGCRVAKRGYVIGGNRSYSGSAPIHFYSERLNALRDKKGYICDMDGVIYRGNQLLDGVREFIEYVKDNDKKIIFLTNTSTSSREMLQSKLASKVYLWWSE
eukprot:TRINITY_DN1632_c0_g1_i3.p1 TRINITY_DN1632_c0_g1~~TRINITY_DN1632_c0_g1_i3.p1  ORF type:complete len:149 (-),score=19.03 TRINITY_DN1632_c0_g1_i3:766-1212(-)